MGGHGRARCRARDARRGGRRAVHRPDAALRHRRGARQRHALRRDRRPLYAQVGEPEEPGPGDPHDQRLRWLQERPTRHGGVGREARIRGLVLLGARLRRLGLQDSARRPGLGRQGGIAADHLPRRRDGRKGRHPHRLRKARPPWQRREAACRRPARGHGRRLLRRPGSVRRGRHRSEARHDRPDRHLERPDLLVGAQQHRLPEGGDQRNPGRAEVHLGPALRGGGDGAGGHPRAGRPQPTDERDLPELRAAGVPCPPEERAGQHPRLRHAEPALPRLGRVLHRQDQDPDAADAGTGRHALQPQRVGGHL